MIFNVFKLSRVRYKSSFTTPQTNLNLVFKNVVLDIFSKISNPSGISSIFKLVRAEIRCSLEDALRVSGRVLFHSPNS